MSLQENITKIKDEISTEEQFFANFFKVEKFYNKYKVILFGVLGSIVAILIGWQVYSYISEKNSIEANNIYSEILAKNEIEKNLALLQNTNETLYNIALYQTSNGEKGAANVAYLEDLKLYNDAVSKEDIEALNQLIMDQDFLLKDFAIVSKSLFLVEKNEYKKAKETIAVIAETSALYPIASMIQHFLLTK